MADVAAEIFVQAINLVVERLIQHVKDNEKLIADAQALSEKLQVDKSFLENYLKDEAAGQNKLDSSFLGENLLRSVRECINKAEDAVDSLEYEFGATKSGCYPVAVPTSATSVVRFIERAAESVKEIRRRVEEQCKETGAELPLPDYEDEPLPQKFCCIFEKDEAELKEHLGREANQPDVILITGMHGVGKTALAAKMFLDPVITKQFDKCIWVRVKVPKPTVSDTLRVVLRQLSKESKDTTAYTNLSELCKQVQPLLGGMKLLLVLDNVPEIVPGDDFGILCRAFRQTGKGSKVLITTNNNYLAPIDKVDFNIRLEPLDPKKSWGLLEWKVFSGDPYDPGLAKLGELIAMKCNGLPRRIVSAGEALLKLNAETNGPIERIDAWAQFSVPRDPFTPSSYDALPYYLKPCLLYLGMFPSDSDIPVSKLIQLWIAEGFIPEMDEALEKTAVKYLKDLADRNLVTIKEKRLDSSPKTCRIDESIHAFCRARYRDEGENIRHYFIHDEISRFIEELKSPKSHLRSFVSHSHSKTDEVITLDRRNVSTIREAFKLLRVLDAKPIQVKKIYSDLCRLIHLRYVTITLNGNVLPASIANLRRVRTLKVHTPSTVLRIEADILTMAKLMHFKTNASATFPTKTDASTSKHYNLQTIYGISPKSCTEKFFGKIPNLEKLGICGQLEDLLDKHELLSTLDRVKKLKLLNQASTGQKSKGDLSRLLDKSRRLPPNLKSLTLCDVSLNWELISNTGWMHKLDELKLRDSAFVGDEWKVRDDGFPNLRTLQIVRVNFNKWEASSSQFPQIRRLMLQQCEELREIPLGLADVKTFQELHLHNDRVSYAAISALKIYYEKMRKQRQSNTTDSDITFKLFPDKLHRYLCE